MTDFVVSILYSIGSGELFDTMHDFDSLLIGYNILYV